MKNPRPCPHLCPCRRNPPHVGAALLRAQGFELVSEPIRRLCVEAGVLVVSHYTTEMGGARHPNFWAPTWACYVAWACGGDVAAAALAALRDDPAGQAAVTAAHALAHHKGDAVLTVVAALFPAKENPQ